MATSLEEEIRRRRTADALSLLESPEAQAQAVADAAKPEDKSTGIDHRDWRTWPRSEPDQIPEGHIDLAPPQTSLQIPTPTPESPSGPANVLTDPESGTPYVLDTGEKIPRAELATPAEKELFKPSDVTLPQETVTRTPRATLVDPDPDAQYMTPDVPGFIEGSKNAILNPAAALPTVRRATLVDPDPDAQYLDPELRRAAQAGKAARAYPATAPTGPKAPGTHTELAPPGQMDLRTDEPQAVKPVVPVVTTTVATKPVVTDPGNWRTWTRADGTVPLLEKPAQEPLPTAQSDGTPYPARTQAAGDVDPKAFIVHHTSGRGTVDGVISTLKERGLGVEYVMDRDGIIYKTGEAGAQNIKAGWGPKGTGLNNSNIVGMEIIANDDKDVTPAQTKAFAQFIAVRYPNTPLYGHGEVNPGHKEADEGITAKNAALAYRSGAPGTGSAEVIQQLNASGLNTTHFGYDGDVNLDADSAAGRGKFIDQMVAGYDVALNAAAAKLVGNPSPGETFEYAGRTWRYGDAVPEKYADARFDIFDPNNTALSGGQLGGQAAERKKADWESWERVSPEVQKQAREEGQARQQTVLTTLHDKSANMPEWYHTLEKPITGVSDDVRNAVREDLKQQLTTYAQDYYKEPDANKAFQRIISTPDLGTFTGEILSKLGPNFSHAWLSMAQQADSPTQTKLIDFVNSVHPEATPEARTALIKEVMSRTGKARVDFVNALYNHALTENPDSVKNVNMYQLLDAIDVSAQPGMQVREAENHAKVAAAVAQNQRNLRQDPTMENTYGGVISSAIAAAPKNMAEAFLPVIGQSAMFSEIYTDTLAGLRKEHPDWSEDTLKAKAAASSLPQDIAQEIVNLATAGVGGGLLKGIPNQLARIVATSITHGVVGGGAGTMQQVVANITTGRPWDEGLGQAAAAAFTQSALGSALIGSLHAARGRAEETGTVRVRTPLGRPTQETGTIHGPEASIIPFNKAPLGDVEVLMEQTRHGPVEPTVFPVSRSDIVGPEVAPAPKPWYQAEHPAAGQQEPIVTRTAERTSFTPAELAEAVRRAQELGGSPQQMMQAIAELKSRERTAHLVDPTTPSLGVEPPIKRVIPSQRQPISAEPPSARIVPPPPRPGHIGESEPWVSREANKTTVANMATGGNLTTGVANRYTAERIAAGELPPIDPNIGITTEELIARGSRMGPEEVNQHVSDLMNNKKGSLRDQAAAVRAEEARLTQHSRYLGLKSEKNQGNVQLKIDAENAHKDLTDFLNGPVKKLKETFHVAGMGLQGEPEVDLSTYNGLREKFLKEVGQESPPSAEPRLRETANRVRKAHAAEYDAMTKLSNEIEKQASRRKLPTAEEVRLKAMKIMKVMPCPT